MFHAEHIGHRHERAETSCFEFIKKFRRETHRGAALEMQDFWKCELCFLKLPEHFDRPYVVKFLFLAKDVTGNDRKSFIKWVDRWHSRSHCHHRRTQLEP